MCRDLNTGTKLSLAAA